MAYSYTEVRIRLERTTYTQVPVHPACTTHVLVAVWTPQVPQVSLHAVQAPQSDQVGDGQVVHELVANRLPLNKNIRLQQV